MAQTTISTTSFNAVSDDVQLVKEKISVIAKTIRGYQGYVASQMESLAIALESAIQVCQSLATLSRQY